MSYSENNKNNSLEHKGCVILGYPLDLLFNRKCKFTLYNNSSLKQNKIKIQSSRSRSNSKKGIATDKEIFGGITLPTADSNGTGNIIIRGKPGTAKSTFALQILVSATQKISDDKYDYNGYHSIYISLEESTEDIMAKAKEFEWQKYFREVNILSKFQENVHDHEYGALLRDILKNNGGTDSNNLAENNKEISPLVLLPTLSPRNLFPSKDTENQLFTERYNQLERLLIAYKELEKDEKSSNRFMLGFVCIDPINVFSNRALTREELNRLSGLFKRYDVIGIFVLEDADIQSITVNNHLVESPVNIADMVISLTEGYDKGYYVRYFDISKSRHQHQVYGKHPFRILDEQQREEHRKMGFSINLDTDIIKIFPSLHYIVFGTENQERNKIEDIEQIFTDSKLDNYLRSYLKRPAIIMIDGPGGTNKSALSRDFLVEGLLKEEKEVLMIRFRDNTPYQEGKGELEFMLNQELVDDEGKSFLNDFDPCVTIHDNNTKRHISVYSRNMITKKNKKIIKWEQRYIEIIYKSGYILPEEFIDIFLGIIKNYENIKRIVLDDVGQIGVSYPLLFSSDTAGELFLTAFVHIVRNYNMNLVMTGSIDEYSKADDIVKRARTLTDSSISTSHCDVFGYRYVLLKGEGLVAGKSVDVNEYDNNTESVPAVVIPHGRNMFEINTTKLQGLVGFDKGEIYRPGLSLYIFQKTKCQEAYCKEIKTMLERAFVAPPKNDHSTEADQKINIFEITPLNTAATHDSFSIFKGDPLDQTVLCTIDEFYSKKIRESFIPLFSTDENKNSSSSNINLRTELKGWFDPKNCITDEKGIVYAIPYYQNVLFMAYNTDYIDNIDHCNWSEIYDKITSENSKFANYDVSKYKEAEMIPVDFNINVNETLSCLFLDALISTHFIKKEKVRKSKFSNKEKHELISNTSIRTQILDHHHNQSGSKNEIDSLRKLLRLSPRSLKYTKNYSTEFTKPNGNTILMKNGAVYFCWYAELIELIVENPHLASKIKVQPLPGLGFKGDWFIGIHKGSVSKNLGVNILEILCSEHEEYKRFIRGVGLPTSSRFYSENTNPDSDTDQKNIQVLNEQAKFKPWPFSLSEMTLDEVFKIHQYANKRDSIDGYEDIRISIASLCKQLLQIEDDSIDDPKKGIMPVVLDRLANILNRLSHSEESNKRNNIQ